MISEILNSDKDIFITSKKLSYFNHFIHKDKKPGKYQDKEGVNDENCILILLNNDLKM